MSSSIILVYIPPKGWSISALTIVDKFSITKISLVEGIIVGAYIKIA